MRERTHCCQKRTRDVLLSHSGGRSIRNDTLWDRFGFQTAQILNKQFKSLKLKHDVSCLEGMLYRLHELAADSVKVALKLLDGLYLIDW